MSQAKAVVRQISRRKELPITLNHARKSFACNREGLEILYRNKEEKEMRTIMECPAERLTPPKQKSKRVQLFRLNPSEIYQRTFTIFQTLHNYRIR